MSTVPATPNFGGSGSVQNTVQKEMRRRKILVGVFVALLLVPVAVAVLFLSAAPLAAPPTASSQAPLSSELQLKVNSNDKALAALQQQVVETKSIAQGAQTSLQQLTSSQTQQAQQVQALRGDLQQTQAAVQHTQAVVEQAQALPPPPPPSAEQNAALQRNLEALRAQVATLSQQVQQVQQQNVQLQKQVTTINRRFEIQPIHPQ
jgi:hypothetical protein